MHHEFDIFIIGGGINGCGIARDAAGRKYKVGLAEMNDFASGTSSKASKLIHGGLRYLEHFEFRLVREALSEREVLLKMAPHIIWPLRFVLPHHRDMRPAWLLQLGLFLYDHLGKRKLLPPSKKVKLKADVAGKPLNSEFSLGFEYSDCWVDDARLVVLNAKDAEQHGAVIHTRTKVVSAKREAGIWRIELKDLLNGDRSNVTAQVLINAAGPWVDQVLVGVIGNNCAKNVRMVKGSHIVVPRLFEHDRAYIFQNADGRVIFVIPYEEDFSLIGTTDQDYKGDPAEVEISQEETSYLCQAASNYFKAAIGEDDVVWAYSGVRPLFDDGATAAQEATRDYVLRVDNKGEQAPLINIFGGKITTYRKLSEAMLEKIENLIGAKGPAWTANSHLPGGDFDPRDVEKQLGELLADYPFLDRVHARRLLRAYGTRAWTLLGDASSKADMGLEFGASLSECEVNYLIANEWALCAEDILWRRTKLGLRLSGQQIAHLDKWINRRVAGRVGTSH